MCSSDLFLEISYFVHKSGNGCDLFGGRSIQLFNEVVLFAKSDFLMLMLLPTFDQNFRVRGDGFGVHCVLPFEFRWGQWWPSISRCHW